MILSTTYDKYLLLFTTKILTDTEFSQKSGFNATTGIIRNADSEFDNVNDM